MIRRALLTLAFLGMATFSGAPHERLVKQELRLRAFCEDRFLVPCLMYLQEQRADLERGFARSGVQLAEADAEELFLVLLEAERRFGVDHRLLAALAVVESAVSPDAVSPKGALGMLQILPETARFLWPQFLARLEANDPLHGFDPVADARSPRLSILLGAFYVERLRHEFGGNETLALASYNAGPARVRQVFEEEDEIYAEGYVEKVRHVRKRFKTRKPFRPEQIADRI